MCIGNVTTVCQTTSNAPVPNYTVTGSTVSNSSVITTCSNCNLTNSVTGVTTSQNCSSVTSTNNITIAVCVGIIFSPNDPNRIDYTVIPQSFSNCSKVCTTCTTPNNCVFHCFLVLEEASFFLLWVFGGIALLFALLGIIYSYNAGYFSGTGGSTIQMGIGSKLGAYSQVSLGIGRKLN